jgi:GMP synthase (glutamine-hydrolysing)
VKPLLCLRHEEPDHLGTAAVEFARHGIQVRYLDLWKDAALPGPGEVAGVVALGGVMNVDQTPEHPFLAPERDFIRAVVDAQRPFLGVCLGAQILARAFDAPVRPAPHRELGFVPLRPTDAAADDPVLGCLRPGDRMFQWHEDTFDLPEGATLLAVGDQVRNQAFSLGSRAWGIQFHAEVTHDLLEDWLPGSDDDSLRGRWGRSADEVRNEAQVYLAAQIRRARELFDRFADAVAAGS